MDGVDVRPCSAADMERLRVAWPTRDDVHRFHVGRTADGSTTYLVAWDGDEPLGVGVLNWTGPVGARARAAHPDVVKLNHLQVRAGSRGRGVGSALIGAAEQAVRDRGLDRLAVGIADDNPDAERLYRRLGYAATGVWDVTEYAWTDDRGVRREERERHQLLVKRLHLFVVSVTLRNTAGDLLLVRKRGTDRFMLPGGKVEPGETHVAAAVREVAEEVGLDLSPGSVGLLGRWSAGAANEPGMVITSDVFTAPLPGEPAASAEIEELRWLPIDPSIDHAADPSLSPMLTEHVIAVLLAGQGGGRQPHHPGANPA